MIGRKTISNDLAWNACVVLTAPPSSIFRRSVFEIRSSPVSIGWWRISRRVVKRLKQESYCNLQDDDINKNKNKNKNKNNNNNNSNNNNNNNRKTTFKGHFLKWLSMPFFFETKRSFLYPFGHSVLPVWSELGSKRWAKMFVKIWILAKESNISFKHNVQNKGGHDA